MSYTSTVSASLRQFLPCFRQKTFTDGPTSARWSKLLSWGAAGVLEYRQYFGNIYSAGTRSISGFCSADTLYSKRPSISGFDTADTPVLAVLLLLILPVLAVFRPSVLLILPVLSVFRPSVLLILPVLAVRNVLDTPSTKYTGSICNSFSSYISCLTLGNIYIIYLRPHLGILLFLFVYDTSSIFSYQVSLNFSGGVFCCALVPGTLAFDLPPLIL